MEQLMQGLTKIVYASQSMSSMAEEF